MSETTSDGPAIFVLGSYVAACTLTVDRMPAAGETLGARAFLLEAGGKGLNVAIGLRRLGATVSGLIAAGDDPFGDLAATALAQADLPAGMLRRVPGQSGMGVGLIDGRGETVIVVYPGANHSLSAGDVAAARETLRAASHVVAQFEIGDAPIVAAFAAAGPGSATVLNPSPFRPIDPAILRTTDILIVNETEAIELARSLGLPDPGCGAMPAHWSALGERMFGAGVKMFVVTRGSRDAILWRHDGLMLVQPSFAVSSVDGIGAGDAFLAGFVVMLASGRPIAEALRTAAACGAIATLRCGVAAALPTHDDLAIFLRAHS